MSEHTKQDSESVYSPAETDVVTSPEPASSPDKLDLDEDESPLLREEPVSVFHKKEELKSKGDEVLIADNSHLLVEEKLEKMREAEEAAELKKIRARRKEK